ncbi:hypothetical protein ABT301_14325, partial [Streptomyces sp. NPDC000987]|uniref:hypothetical protein n=1 Tax=Streptomyces sp. NPDC000987 TaxID=3154374 RepID=UPI003328A670
DSDHGKKEDGGKEDGFGKKEHDKDGGFGKPHGGMHTGGGALTAVNGDWGSGGDPKYDPETYKDKGKEKDWGGEKSWGGEKKPHGGMHTGGGALANPGVTAGGLAVLAVAGAGLYTARRKKSAAGLA